MSYGSQFFELIFIFSRPEYLDLSFENITYFRQKYFRQNFNTVYNLLQFYFNGIKHFINKFLMHNLKMH
jgi:hypothetical protein